MFQPIALQPPCLQLLFHVEHGPTAGRKLYQRFRPFGARHSLHRCRAGGSLHCEQLHANRNSKTYSHTPSRPIAALGSDSRDRFRISSLFIASLFFLVTCACSASSFCRRAFATGFLLFRVFRFHSCLPCQRLLLFLRNVHRCC